MTHLSALLAGLAIAGCVTLDDSDPQELATESASTTTGTASYKCMFPLCGGTSIVFDSRTLMLRNCALDARKVGLDCDMLPADSPAMPSAFFADAAIQAACSDGARFTCSGDELVSCVCPDTSGTSATASTGRRTYNPIVIRKRIDKS